MSARVDPVRVLAALEALGWPDDRTTTEHPRGALYDAAEEAIQAADRANRHGDLIDRLASCLASILARVEQSDPNAWVGRFSNAHIVGWRSLLVEYTCPCSLDKPWRCRSKGQPCPTPSDGT